jgi:hypothetical protein
VHRLGDHGTIAQDATRSVIKGKSGYSLNPGSKEVYNAKAKKWDKQSTVSFAPLVAFGGRVIAVPKTTKQADLAWSQITGRMGGAGKQKEIYLAAVGKRRPRAADPGVGA